MSIFQCFCAKQCTWPQPHCGKERYSNFNFFKSQPKLGIYASTRNMFKIVPINQETVCLHPLSVSILLSQSSKKQERTLSEPSLRSCICSNSKRNPYFPSIRQVLQFYIINNIGIFLVFCNPEHLIIVAAAEEENLMGENRIAIRKDFHKER